MSKTIQKLNKLKNPESFLQINTIKGFKYSVGLLYTIVSFFSNQIRESYKDVIAEYKSMVANVKLSSKHIQKQLKEAMSEQGTGKTIGGSYQVIHKQEIETEKE